MLSILFSNEFQTGLLLICVLGVGILYFNHYLERKKKKELFGSDGVSLHNLTDLLKKLKVQIDNLEEEIKNLKNRQETEEKKAKGYLQKIGFMRFNPFSDTGGQQSFIMSLQDREKNGILISNLVGRSSARWIVKKFSKGEASDLKLSDEEKKVVEAANSV